MTKTVIAHCTHCDRPTTHDITPSGPKCKACHAKGTCSRCGEPFVACHGLASCDANIARKAVR